MSLILVILFLSLTYGTTSEANHDKNLPSASVVGTVYCDTCFQSDFSRASHFISGHFASSIDAIVQPFTCHLNLVANV